MQLPRTGASRPGGGNPVGPLLVISTSEQATKAADGALDRIRSQPTAEAAPIKRRHRAGVKHKRTAKAQQRNVLQAQVLQRSVAAHRTPAVTASAVRRDGNESTLAATSTAAANKAKSVSSPPSPLIKATAGVTQQQR